MFIHFIFIFMLLSAVCSESYTKKGKARRYRNSANKRKQWHESRKPAMYNSRDISIVITDDDMKVNIVNNEMSRKYLNVKSCGISGLVGQRIVNGKEASVGEYPWIVSIHNWDSMLGCAGSIINDRWIVSAAHCFKTKNGQFLQANSLSIKVGSIYSNKGTRYRISKLIVHYRYNNDDNENSDIALMKTDRPIVTEYYRNINLVNGICLPRNSYEEPNSNQILVIGWGKTYVKNKYMSGTLREVVLPVISDKQCAEAYGRSMVDHPNGYTVYKSQICTYSHSKDACQGDSGGPAMVFVNGRAILVGVVSYGVGCASDYPGVFTQVSYYLDWIDQKIRL